MADYASIDDNSFPEVVVTFTGESATHQNFQNYLDALKRLYVPKDNLGIIFDATKAKLPGRKFQKMQADWLKKNESMMKENCVGTAYVIENTTIRAVLKMIFAITPQPVPYKVCSGMDEARDYIAKQLFDK
ncbi:MAG: STAS/SEC14 domain-containing protein [Flavobacteriales bacterium]|nr:STAS/SEC14 domain-containing protein [Flavobacteriales bacterium]